MFILLNFIFICELMHIHNRLDIYRAASTYITPQKKKEKKKRNIQMWMRECKVCWTCVIKIQKMNNINGSIQSKSGNICRYTIHILSFQYNVHEMRKKLRFTLSLKVAAHTPKEKEEEKIWNYSKLMILVNNNKSFLCFLHL